MYPENDSQFEEETVFSVTKQSEGWSITRADGWYFFVPEDSPVEPLPGMAARFYGRGIGATVRGLFLDGKQVFYRTEADQDAYQLVTRYGADAAEWLRRWDNGDTVWSISMGGLGPSYEQAIQIVVAEILRHTLAVNYNHKNWSDQATWEKDRDAIDSAVNATDTVKNLGNISGAMWGAAMNLALQLYRRGPIAVMTDDAVKDRHIQVRRSFPQG